MVVLCYFLYILFFNIKILLKKGGLFNGPENRRNQKYGKAKSRKHHLGREARAESVSCRPRRRSSHHRPIPGGPHRRHRRRRTPRGFHVSQQVTNNTWLTHVGHFLFLF